MTKEQLSIIPGMIGAAAVGALFVWAGTRWYPFALPPLDSAGDRLAFTLRAEVFAGLTLLLGIGTVARQRFFSPEAIGGEESPRDHAIRINLRYVQNTTEQLSLAVVAHLALAATLSPGAMAVIPVLVVYFVLARVAFWAGYHHSPTSRAFGFAATFYPTVAVYLYVIYRVLV